MLSLVACEKENITSKFEDVPVVEAYLKANNVFEMKISRQIPFTDEVDYSTDDINNLNIFVSVDGSTYMLSSQGEGVYVDSALIISEGTQYELQFKFNDKNVTAITYIPAKPSNFQQSRAEMIIEQPDLSGSGGPFGGFPDQPDPVEFTWNNSDGSYYLIVVENIENNLVPVRDFGDNEIPAPSFRNEPSQGNSFELDSRRISYYGTHRIILYHLNPDYALLYDDGETTSQNLTTPLTGITNGVGIFTGMHSDTLLLEVKDQ